MRGERAGRSRASAWIPFGLWIAVLFALSSIPNPAPPGGQLPFVDKAGHLGVYGILGVLWARARARPGARAWAIAFFVGAVIGVLDEAYQSTVPGREVDALDVVADAFGAAAGAWLWSWMRRRSTPAS